MKTIAITLNTGPLNRMTEEKQYLLQELLVDKRLKKQESIMAYFKSSDYDLKKLKYQSTHAEFGEITGIAITDGHTVESWTGESDSLEAFSKNLSGVERVVGFNLLSFEIPFILKRSMFGLSDAGGRAIGADSIREKFYSPFGLGTVALFDLKQKWMRDNKEYSDLTLADLCILMGDEQKDFPHDIEERATKIFDIYERMRGYLGDK